MAEAAAPTREQIERFQLALLPSEDPAYRDAKHHFAPGIYAREYLLPAGGVVVGKIHKHEHLLLVLKGHAWVVDERGRREVFGGFIHLSKPGDKRVVYADEPTVFVTVHHNPSDTQDLEQIELEHIEPERADIQAIIDRHREATSCLGAQ